MQKSSRSAMASGAGRNIRMIDGSRRRRAVQIRTQGAQTGLVVTNGVILSSAQQKKSPARIIYRTHPITNDNGRATSAVTCWTTSYMTFL